ncbi:hypothetical protein HK096_007476, partial [Nowakowskiella sp. JEL0078]
MFLEKNWGSSFGVVKLVKEKLSSRYFACKCVEKSKRGRVEQYEQTQKEVSIMKR